MSASASEDRLESVATEFRKATGFAEQGFVDAIDLLNRAVEHGFIATFRTVNDAELPDVEAYWDPADRSIVFRESIYSNAAAEEVRARFVVAHELAHALLAHPVRNRRVSGGHQFGRFTEQHERDADALATAILAPLTAIDLEHVASPKGLAAEFGLPAQIAERRFVVVDNLPVRRGKRQAAVPKAKRKILIDTGDYEDASWAMSLNAERRG